MARRFLLFLALALAVPLVMADSSNCGASSGGSAAGSSPAAPKEVSVGTPMKSDSGEQVTVMAFKRPFSTGNQFDNPGSGKEYIQVTYKLVNGSRTEWSLPLFALKLIDANGQKYDETIVSTGEDSVDSIAAGGHVDSASVVYAVPTGVALDVAWQPNIFETTVLQTKLA